MQFLIDAGALLARLGVNQVTVARELAATALGKTVEQLVEDDTDLVAKISVQLTRLQQEATREDVKIQLGLLGVQLN